MDEVIELTTDDWAELKDISLRALADAPDAFRTIHCDAVEFPEAEWRRRLHTANPTYAVRDGEGTVAMGGGVAVPGSEVAMVWGMWTAPEARGRGHAAVLLRRIIAWADTVGRTAHLHVTEGNDAARRLYVRHGFEPTGSWEPLREDSLLRVEELVLRRG